MKAILLLTFFFTTSSLYSEDSSPIIAVTAEFDTILLGESLKLRVEITAPTDREIEVLTQADVMRTAESVDLIGPQDKQQRIPGTIAPQHHEYQIVKAGGKVELLCPTSAWPGAIGAYKGIASPQIVKNKILPQFVFQFTCIDIENATIHSNTRVSFNRTAQYNERNFEISNIQIGKKCFLMLRRLADVGQVAMANRLFELESNSKIIVISKRLDKPLSEEFWATFNFGNELWFARFDVYGTFLEKRRLDSIETAH